MAGWTRRTWLQQAALGAAGAFAGIGAPRSARPAGRDGPILIVAAATGGYSIQDAFLALRESEVSPQRRETLNVYPDDWVEDFGPFRAVQMPEGAPDHLGFAMRGQRRFLQRHRRDLLVYTTRSSAVNHLVAQQRVLNGDGGLRGRTLMEEVASQLGAGRLLANVNMAPTGFAAPGVDPTVPSWAQPVAIANPWLFPLGLHGHQGLRPAWHPEDVARARQLRRSLEDLAPGRSAPRWDAWGALREQAAELEAANLVERLNVAQSSSAWRLEDYGVPPNDAADRLAEAFPYLDLDPFEAQAALAFLLVRAGVSSVVTIGLPMATLDAADRPLNPRAAFDASHGRHRYYQALVWDRYLSVLSSLIDLLQSEPTPDGGTLWDHCVLFMPSEFGRVQHRPGAGGGFGSAHDFEGAGMIASPRVRGGRVWGGVSPVTGRTVGFDRRTGALDPERPGLSEAEAVAAVLAALDLDTRGLPDLSAVRRR